MPPQPGDDRRPELVALGHALKRRREAKHWTLDELADAAGLSRRAVAYIETGSYNPGLMNIIDLAAALGADPVTVIAEALGDREQ